MDSTFCLMAGVNLALALEDCGMTSGAKVHGPPGVVLAILHDFLAVLKVVVLTVKRQFREKVQWRQIVCGICIDLRRPAQ